MAVVVAVVAADVLGEAVRVTVVVGLPDIVLVFVFVPVFVEVGDMLPVPVRVCAAVAAAVTECVGVVDDDAP